MWVGGVRVIIPNEEGKILMVRQHHEGRDLWIYEAFCPVLRMGRIPSRPQ